ncbi:MAG: hypothetical protein B6I36_06805 [Desulfobacteraceae bacterium 4572_35.1]|nr:MAG: hypothetical protein B6I36_06805 [Desulfobacteraceae bacterium 4572_35.1]
MSSRKKIILNVVLFLSCILVAGAAILYNYSYKICWHCTTEDFYQRGKEFVCRDKTELRQTGLDFLNLAANKKQPEAQILLAESYLGKLPAGYVAQDDNALKCLKELLGNNKKASISLFNQAYTELKQQELKDNQLLFNLARLIEEGILTSDNPKLQAHALYLQAADNGNYAAMSKLGFDYHKKGQYAEANKWLKMAAEAGKNAQPALILGDNFFYGKGETVNYEKAVSWYRTALETQRKLFARASEEERLVAEDAPKARIEMAMLKLQKTRMLAPMTLHYTIKGNAEHYVIYTEDHSKQPIGSVKKDVAGTIATIDSSIDRALSIATDSKTFSSMNDGMEWLLQAYARSRYGSYTKVNFILNK